MIQSEDLIRRLDEVPADEGQRAFLAELISECRAAGWPLGELAAHSARRKTHAALTAAVVLDPDDRHDGGLLSLGVVRDGPLLRRAYLGLAWPRLGLPLAELRVDRRHQEETPEQVAAWALQTKPALRKTARWLKNQAVSTAGRDSLLMEAGRKKCMPFSHLRAVDEALGGEPCTGWELARAFALVAQNPEPGVRSAARPKAQLPRIYGFVRLLLDR